MNKLKLSLESLSVESFDTTATARAKGTVFGEQCTCYTQCTCPGIATCDGTCGATCPYTCDDASCAGTCGNTCASCYDQGTCWESCENRVATCNVSCYVTCGRGATCLC